MALAVVALTGAASASPPVAEGSPPPPAPRIVGGDEATNGEYPFQVAVLRRGVAGAAAAQFCGGTLVARTVVLTAAHCVEAPQAAGGIDVLVGGHDLTTSQGTRIAVTSAEVHPRFDPMLYDNDVAVLHLSAPAPAEPVRLVGIGEEAAWSPGVVATTIGWGLTSFPGTRSPVLREVGVPLVSDAACAAAYGPDLVAATMTCAGPVAGGRDSCNGDSGGPLLVPDPDDPSAWLQVGITSWGPDGCGLAGQPGVYTEVASVRPWVDGSLPAHARFSPVTPARLLDTRRGVPLFDGFARTVDVTGVGGLPTRDVTSVVLTVTALGATQPTHLTVWPTGEPKPPTSNLNVAPGRTVATTVLARVGPNGTVNVAGRSGSTHVVVDAVGWFDDGRTDVGARFRAVAPSRLFDTRTGAGGVGVAPVGAGATVDVAATGRAGVPPTGATAVLLNLTATGATAATNLTVWGGGPRPPTSNLNPTPGTTVANLVVAPLDAEGGISVFNRAGTVDVVGDVVGWFGTPDGATASSDHLALTPTRVLDTRRGLGAAAGAVGGGATVEVAVAGVGGVPEGADAVVLTVTAVDPTAATHLTAFPSGTTAPRASNLNVAAGQTASNLVVVPLGADGRVALRNQAGSTHVVADVVGAFVSAAPG